MKSRTWSGGQITLKFNVPTYYVYDFIQFKSWNYFHIPFGYIMYTYIYRNVAKVVGMVSWKEWVKGVILNNLQDLFKKKTQYKRCWVS